MGGFSILLGLYMEIGTWLLVLFLLPTSFLMHNFWQDMDPMQQQVEGAMFMKNIALSGAALIIYWVVQTHGYGPFVLRQPL
jgi:putative oxidoreductase